MFNFFSEIKKDLKLPDFEEGYNIVNINGKGVYVEGHKGLISLSEELVKFKVKDGVVRVEGKFLKLKVMSSATLNICGEIQSVIVD